jgi:type VI secretion system secreted protein Hcp
MAAVDYFLKIDGIEGESIAKGHDKEIDIESFSWGETQSGTAGEGSGQGAGRAVSQDLHFTKKVDKATPNLMLACATGKHLKFATLSARKAGGKQEDYLIFKLEDALVSSYQVGGSGGSDIVPLEQVSINFAKIALTYKAQKADGSLAGPVDGKYDFAARVKL